MEGSKRKAIAGGGGRSLVEESGIRWRGLLEASASRRERSQVEGTIAGGEELSLMERTGLRRREAESGCGERFDVEGSGAVSGGGKRSQMEGSDLYY